MVTSDAQGLRVEINSDQSLAYLGSKPISISFEAALLLDELLKHRDKAGPEAWIAGPEILKRQPRIEERLDKLIKKMPEKVRQLIESVAGKGRRLKLDGLKQAKQRR
jgi:hypothetical protein